MKVRESKAYLVVGNVHLGSCPAILRVFSQIQKHYGAEVIHLGSLATMDERKMYQYRVRRIRTWEKQTEEQRQWRELKESQEIDRLEAEIAKLKDARARLGTHERPKVTRQIRELEARKAGREAKLRDFASQKEAEREHLLGEIGQLEDAQHLRIETLKAFFGRVTLVTNPELHLPSLRAAKDVTIHNFGLNLSKHLHLSSVSANGDNVSSNPITKKSFNYFKQKGTSFITPHPIPAMVPFKREGLNQARNYWTTGSLKGLEDPNRPSEFYKAVQFPCAILVMVDEKNGEFHAKQLHVDYVRDEIAHRHRPMVLDDGMVFSERDAIEAPSTDRAIHSTDEHCPHEHLGVLGVVRSLIKLHQPATYITGGDTCDFGPISRHIKSLLRERENKRLKADLTAMMRYLEIAAGASSIKERVMLDSNHHEWLTQAIEENPWLEGLLDWPTLAKTILKDWRVYHRKAGDSQTYRFGDLVIRHGDQEGGVEQGSQIYGKYLCGHWHSWVLYLRAGSAGPACKLGPKYLENRETSWQNCVTTITRHGDTANFHIKPVFHSEETKKSRFAYGRHIYEADFYEYK